MMSRLSKLAIAAVLASSLPGLALARDREHDRRPPAYAPPAYAPPAYAPPAYAPPAYSPPAYAPPAARPAPHLPRHEQSRWHEASWRDRQIAHLRIEFRELERRRAEFYARHHRGRGEVRRFERWYAGRRTELEHRWNELQYYAWR